MVIAVFTIKEGFDFNKPEQKKEVKQRSKNILKVKIVEEKFYISDELVNKEDLFKMIEEKKVDKKVIILEIAGKTKYKNVIFGIDTVKKSKMKFTFKKIEG